jgi:CBS domain-containing protein
MNVQDRDAMICPACSHDNFPGQEYCSNCLHDLTQLDRPTSRDRVERSLMDDPVSVLQPRKAVTLSPDATVDEAIRIMLERDIGAVLIVAADGRLVGIFSERDLLTRVAGQVPDYADRPVSEFMTSAPETVRPTDTLAFALHKMDSGGYRHLPVLKDGQPLGMLSVRDMLRHITRLCKER